MTEQDSCLVDVCFFLAQECHAKGQYDKAEYWYERALKFDPANPDIHQAMSYIAVEKKDFNAVVAHATHAMPKFGALAQYERALALLMLGKYKQGFTDYDARLEFPYNKTQREKRFGDLPYWMGEDCNTLFVCGEQGFGDIFQFSRYVPLIKSMFNVKHVIFEVPKSCVELFAYNFKHVEVVPLHEPLPKIDYHIQLISLCRLFDTRLGTIPPLELKADPKYVDKWKIVKGCVGFVLNGRKDEGDLQVSEWNARRSITREQIKPVLEKDIVPFFFEDNMDSIKSWADTAGIMANLDLLISIDTGPIHLAGAMQIPAWLLQHRSPCWRWGLSGDHTPWYTEQLTQFRQKDDGDWVPVIDNVVERLEFEKRKAA